MFCAIGPQVFMVIISAFEIVWAFTKLQKNMNLWSDLSIPMCLVPVLLCFYTYVYITLFSITSSKCWKSFDTHTFTFLFIIIIFFSLQSSICHLALTSVNAITVDVIVLLGVLYVIVTFVYLVLCFVCSIRLSYGSLNHVSCIAAKHICGIYRHIVLMD